MTPEDHHRLPLPDHPGSLLDILARSTGVDDDVVFQNNAGNSISSSSTAAAHDDTGDDVDATVAGG